MARKATAVSPPMVHRLSLTKARVNLGAVIKRVHLNKERFVLEKDGIPVAGIMDIDEFEDYLELQDPKVKRIIEKGRLEYLAGKSRPAEELLAKLLGQRKRKTTRRKIS